MRRSLFMVLPALVLSSGLAAAQPGNFEGMQSARGNTGSAVGSKPSLNDGRPPILDGVGIEQRPGEQLPLDVPFTDETGAAVTLDRYFGSRPVVLSLVYYRCPMLCTQVLNGIVSSLKGMNLEAGKDFDLLTISFNPEESAEMAAAKKKAYVDMTGRPETGGSWHFLTGSPESIQRVADAVGFTYKYDEETQQFAHASGITILTPEGVISRYLFGVEYAPRDLRLALVEASDNKVGTIVDQVLLFCFHYDPVTGKYGAAAIGSLRVAAVITLGVLFGFIFVMLRRDRRRVTHLPSGTGAR